MRELRRLAVLLALALALPAGGQAIRADLGARRADGGASGAGPLLTGTCSTPGRVPLISAADTIGCDSGLTYDAATDVLTVTGGIKDSALTSGRVAIVGTDGVLEDDAGMTYAKATDTLSLASGHVNAAVLTATALGTPGSITITPTLTQFMVITTVEGSSIADGYSFTIHDGTTGYIFEMDSTGGVTGGRIAIPLTGSETADQIRDLVITYINLTGILCTASSGGAAQVLLTMDTPGVLGGAKQLDGTFTFSAWADPSHATTVTYRLVARLADGTTTEAGAASTTTTSVATLSAANFNRLTWSSVTSAYAYDVYRTVSPTSPATTGKIVSATTLLTVDDTGLAGDSGSVPTSNGTGRVNGAATRLATTAGNVVISSAAAPSAGQALVAESAAAASWAAIISGLTAGVIPKAASATTLGNSSLVETAAGDITTTPAGTALDLSSAAPTQAAASQAGTALTIAASAAVDGTGTHLAAVGGPISISPGAGVNAGAAGNLTLATATVLNAAVAADDSTHFLKVTGTLPSVPSVATSGVNISVTGAGNLAYSENALSSILNAGYAGNGRATALSGINNSVSVNNSNWTGNGTIGVYGEATAGAMATGVFGLGKQGSSQSLGVVGLGNGSTTVNVGVIGYAWGATSNIGGFFSLGNVTLEATALLVDNHTVAKPIFLARDNGTRKFEIADGGNTYVYGAYTDDSNYERMSLTTTAGAAVNILAETAGTGADNLDVNITPAGTGSIIIPGSKWFRSTGNTDLYVSAGDRANGNTAVMWLSAGSATTPSTFNIGGNGSYTSFTHPGYDIWEQKRATAAQTHRLYGTYTDASNYERLSLSTTAGTGVTIAAETAGTGADNLDVTITPAGTGAVKVTKAVIGSQSKTIVDATPTAFASFTIAAASAASGTIVCPAKSAFVDGETLTISDGTNTPVVFEFDVAGDGVTGGRTQVNISTDTTNLEVAARLHTAINAEVGTLLVTSTNGGAGTLTLANDVAGVHGNVAMSDTVVSALFIPTGMTGGSNAAAMHSGEIEYTVRASKTTALQILAGKARFVATREATVYTVSIAEVGSQALAAAAGTLTGSLSIAGAGGVVTVSATFDTSLASPDSMTIDWRITSTDSALAVTAL